MIIYAAVAVVIGLRLYQKYYKKDKAGQPGQSKQNELTSQSDDYEPYSKK
jgi:hypothetical protein